MTRESHRVRFGGSKRQTAEERYQPRPAFGLRPWFALLRRARSLRRFAFAIVSGSVPGEHRYRSSGSVTLGAGSWRSPPVAIAVSFTDRLVGMRRSTAEGLLVRSGSVHAIGLREPIRIVHLDQEGTVLHQDLLTAGRRLRARGAWILELRIDAPGPAPGATLTVLPSSAP